MALLFSCSYLHGLNYLSWPWQLRSMALTECDQHIQRAGIIFCFKPKLMTKQKIRMYCSLPVEYCGIGIFCQMEPHEREQEICFAFDLNHLVPTLRASWISQNVMSSGIVIIVCYFAVIYLLYSGCFSFFESPN